MSWTIEIDVRKADLEWEIKHIQDQMKEKRGQPVYPIVWLYGTLRIARLKKTLKHRKPEVVSITIPKC